MKNKGEKYFVLWRFYASRAKTKGPTFSVSRAFDQVSLVPQSGL
jgi:hypothetical protein